MGRRIPTNDIVLIHPLLSFTLLAAGMAATIAILSGLCGVRHRRKSSPPPPLPTPKKKGAVSSPPTTTTITSTTTMKKPPSAELTEHRSELLPAPPAKKKLVREAYSCKDMTKFMSERKIAASLSMRVTRSLSMVRNRDQAKEESSKKGKLKTEDSIWMKTIILGEKCRVPDEEEEGVIYQSQGRRISAYHPRTVSSLSISRQCSFIDQEAVPRHELRK